MPDEVITQPQVGAEPVKPVVEPVVEADEFDKERAMKTITELRQFEKLSKSQAKKLAEYEEAEKKRQDAELSETEKLKKQLAEKDALLKLRDHQELQRQAATEAELSISFAKRLQGETLEELVADAKSILAELPKAGKPNINPTNPGGNATGGETDEQKLARIHGRGIDIFDPVTIKKMGGGVSIVKSAED